MIIPNVFPYPEDKRRDAENLVFNKLKEIFSKEKNFDIYYNRDIWNTDNPNLPEDMEGDFILFHEKAGFLVIEVKGGIKIEYIASEDKWYSTSRSNQRYEIKDPFKQARKVKHGIIEQIKLAYKWAIDNDIAKEQARAVLPEGLTESRLYMSGNLRSWIHYCQLRMGHGTQLEHIKIAEKCWKILEEEFPEVTDAVNKL